MKKRSSHIYKLIAAVIALALVVQMPAAYAASLSDLKKERSQLEADKKALNESMKQKQSEISSNQSRQEQIIAQLEAIGAKINGTNKEIEVVTLDIEIAKEEISELENEMAALQKKIDERDALLQERARAIQTSGTVSYIDVLLGANSFVDFIDRFSAVSTLMDADRKIMREQKEDKEKLEEQKLEMIAKKEKLEENKAQLETLKASLYQQKLEKNKLVDELEAEEAKLHAEHANLEDELHDNVELSEELEKQINAEQKRIAAELKRQKALEAAKKKKAASKASSGRSKASGNLPAVAAGTWTRPAAGRFSSGFGGRDIGPIGSKYHLGVDIANAIGTPVVAAADGVVSYVGSMNGYGNVVMVTHSIEGQLFTTVYGHLSGFNTSVGTSVTKGQQIARMGNTGNSTGPHVHFEIHVGEWNGKRTNAVNPLRYISL